MIPPACARWRTTKDKGREGVSPGTMDNNNLS